MAVGSWNFKLIFAVIAAGLGSGFQHGYNTGVVNLPEHVIKDWINVTSGYLSNNTLSILWSTSTSIMNIGGMIGGVCSGIAAHWMGPKIALLFNNIIVGAACALMIVGKFIPSFPVYVVGRFLVGLNCGFNSGLSPMYLAEIAPVNLRGAIGTVYQLVVTISILISQIVGLTYILGDNERWPFLFIIPVVFIIIQIVMLLFSPESPRYLVSKEKDERAHKALTWLRNSPDINDEISELKSEHDSLKSQPKVSLKDMFKEKYLRTPLIISVMLMIAQQLSGINAIMFYSTNTFKNTAHLSHLYASYATIGIGITNVLTTIVAVFIVDKVGRKVILLVGFIGMAIVQALMAVCLHFVEKNKAMMYIVILLVVVYIILFAIGAGPIPWFIVSEMFNQAARTTAVSLAVPVNWFANFVVTLVFPPLEDTIHGFVFLIFTVFNIGFVLFIWKFVHETKNKTIEEITNEFK